MRKQRLFASAAATLMCAAGISAASASTASADDASAKNTEVTAWANHGVHAAANTGSEKLSDVGAGYSYSALCWTAGQPVKVGDVNNNVWIKLDRTWPKDNGFVPAAALNGDKHANVPNKC